MLSHLSLTTSLFVFCVSCSLSVDYIFISKYYISEASVEEGPLVGLCYNLQPITYRSQDRTQRTQSQELKQNHGQMLLTGLFSTAYLACFVIRPRALAQRGHHTYQVLPHQLLIKNMFTTDLPTYQSDEDIVSAEFSSFHMTLACAKLAKLYHKHVLIIFTTSLNSSRFISPSYQSNFVSIKTNVCCLSFLRCMVFHWSMVSVTFPTANHLQ